LSRSRILRASEIKQLDLDLAMQTGNQVWYDLKARLANGRSATVGSNLEKREAEWYRAELLRDLGIHAETKDS